MDFHWIFSCAQNEIKLYKRYYDVFPLYTSLNYLIYTLCQDLFSPKSFKTHFLPWHLVISHTIDCINQYAMHATPGVHEYIPIWKCDQWCKIFATSSMVQVDIMQECVLASSWSLWDLKRTRSCHACDGPLPPSIRPTSRGLRLIHSFITLDRRIGQPHYRNLLKIWKYLSTSLPIGGIFWNFSEFISHCLIWQVGLELQKLSRSQKIFSWTWG